MCESLRMTNWGRVYYTNALALVPLIFVLPGLSEQTVLAELEWTSLAVRVGGRVLRIGAVLRGRKGGVDWLWLASEVCRRSLLKGLPYSVVPLCLYPMAQPELNSPVSHCLAPSTLV
jgi:hypothetical protein